MFFLTIKRNSKFSAEDRRQVVYNKKTLFYIKFVKLKKSKSGTDIFLLALSFMRIILGLAWMYWVWFPYNCSTAKGFVPNNILIIIIFTLKDRRNLGLTFSLLKELLYWSVRTWPHTVSSKIKHSLDERAKNMF